MGTISTACNCFGNHTEDTVGRWYCPVHGYVPALQTIESKYFRKGEIRCKFWETCKLCKDNGCSVSFPEGEEHICPFKRSE